MRISDWSSDVCSSDLMPDSHHRICGSRRPPRENDPRLDQHSRPANRGLCGTLATERRMGGLLHDGHGRCGGSDDGNPRSRSEEHTSELQSLMRISYAVFCLKKKKNTTTNITNNK